MRVRRSKITFSRVVSLRSIYRRVTSSFNSRRADSRGLEMQIKRDKENTTRHYRALEASLNGTEETRVRADDARRE